MAHSSRFKYIRGIADFIVAISAILTFVLGHHTFAFWLAVAFLIALLLHRGVSKASVGGAAAVTIVAILVQLYALPQPSPPFSVSIETALSPRLGDPNIVAEYAEHFVSPVALILFLRIVNLQNAPSNISDVSVQVYSGRRRWGLRRLWVSTSLMPANMPLLVLGSPQAVSANRFTLIGLQIKAELEAGPIGPHDTLGGWAVFDAPSSFDSTPLPLIYRITITDTAGHTSHTVVPHLTGGDILGSHTLRLGPQVPIPPNLIVRHFFYP
jgi:hypothetical protein